MRLILTILFLFSVAYGQTTYYVSNAGSDAANGLTPATSWQTLSKVNSFSFASGDTVKLNSGDSWNERLVPNSNIYITSYGTGAKPTITGFQTITGFTQSGNIWTKTISASAGLNMVLINGQIAHFGRTPNTGYLTYTSKTYKSLTTSLSGTPNYTGATAVVRTAPWVLDRDLITSQSGGTLNLRDSLTYNTALLSNGYFLQGLASLVDTVNEYSYDGTTLTIYSTTTPAVQISTVDTLVWVRKKSNLTIDGVNITGANIAAIQFDTCTNITVKNCSFDYSGTIALSALKSSRLNILNNTINHSLSGGIYARQLDYYTTPVNQCDSAIVTGNTIKNTATIAGMGLGGNARYNAIEIQGLNLGPYVVGNTVDSSGYNGIEFFGKKSVIRNNIVSNFCFVKDDGGGIRTVIGNYLDSAYSDSSVVSSNIIFNGIGAPLGTTVGAEAFGIYFDNNARRIIADSNTVYNCNPIGIGINQTLQITARYNNLYNNTKNFNLTQINSNDTGIVITHNALYANSSLPLIDASGVTFGLNYFKIIDSNYYYNPYYTNPIIKYNGSTVYTLSGWQTLSSQDASSVGIPTTLVTNDAAGLVLNTSLSPITYNLGSTWISNGVSYNSIPLQPINGAIVLKAAYNVFTNSDLRFKKLSQ
jgi:hypothetical protein